ncbi:hypothetical protein Y032_1028g3434 [Ancylostoma ceylanicum]|uniref:Uncharacterized protein n=1 Tax=Ancylostoma ceylanicum TaxID=53326 RepID=A0A016W8G5_9BILA|nr:hypothetical protein Y032_1028g3434 [Ancylostoma ceylanicum]
MGRVVNRKEDMESWYYMVCFLSYQQSSSAFYRLVEGLCLEPYACLLSIAPNLAAGASQLNYLQTMLEVKSGEFPTSKMSCIQGDKLGSSCSPPGNSWDVVCIRLVVIL